jgi:inner membrane protein
MEPVTHFLTGACLGRSGCNRKTAYATLAMVLAAEAPDIDLLWGFRGPVAELQHHRGLAHSLIFAPAMALLVTGFVWLLDRLRKMRPSIPVKWGWVWLFAMLADLSHLALDYTNNYGVRPFFPFNPHWYAWSIVYIFDPWMFLALLLALVIPALLGLVDREIGVRKQRFRGRGWAIGALVFVLGWWGLRSVEHSRAVDLAENGNFTQEPLLRVAAEPTMMSPFTWRVLMETPGTYQTAKVDTLTDHVTTNDYSDVIYKPPMSPALAAAERTYLGRVYLDWSKWPVIEDRGAVKPPGADFAPDANWHTVEFQDLRFGYEPNEGDRTQAPPNPPLSGWVCVGTGGEIEGMFMARHEQPLP